MREKEELLALADALEKADWSNVSIGNKMLLVGAVEALRSALPAPELPAGGRTLQFVRMVQSLLRYTNPHNVAEDHSQQWQAVHHECEVILASSALPAPAPHAEVREALETAKAALIKIRACSIAGCEEGYGKPEKWADKLFASHADVHAAIKQIDAALQPQSERGEVGK